MWGVPHRPEVQVPVLVEVLLRARGLHEVRPVDVVGGGGALSEAALGQSAARRPKHTRGERCAERLRAGQRAERGGAARSRAQGAPDGVLLHVLEGCVLPVEAVPLGPVVVAHLRPPVLRRGGEG